MTSPLPTVGSFLFDYLHAQGIHHAFGIPGDFALPTFRWLDRSKIDLITMTHEPSVAFAADGYARVHGLGLACVTYCVGGLNMLNGVACAYAEKSPVVVISGGPSPADRHVDSLLHHKVRTFDTQRRIYEEVTCATAVLSDPQTAAQEIVRVVEEVRRQCRPGYIEVPYDIVDLPIALPTLRESAPPVSDAELLEAALAEAAGFINRAKQPIIVADIELHRHGWTDLAVALSEKTNIPLAATLLSKSVISETHPNYIGVYSGGMSEPVVQDYVESSDAVILLGAFITDVLLGMNSVTLDRKRCILANTEKIRIGLHGYEQVQFIDFLHGLLEAPIAPRPAFENPNPAREEKSLTDAERAASLSTEAFFRILALNLQENTTLVCDVGDALFGAVALRTTQRKDFLSDAYYLSMGFAMPAAIGVMAANPDSRVVAVIGDGAFQMTGVELSTAAKRGMAPIVIVLNNDGYGTQRFIIDGTFNDIHQWDYTKLTEMLRCGTSHRATTGGELEAALQSAFAADELTLIEVVLPRDSASKPLKRLGEALASQRDSSRRAPH